MPQAAKVLFCDHETDCGGAQLSLLELIGGLDRERYTPLLACSGDGPLADRARDAGAEIHFVPMLFEGKLRKLLGLRRAAGRLADLIRAQRVRLVHTNTLIAGYCGLSAARRGSVPCVWHLRDLSYPGVGRWACRRANRVLANSSAAAAALGGPPDKLRVVYNGVDAAFFAGADGESVRAELGVAAGETVVGMVGRLDPWKGHRELLEAAAQIEAPAVFWIVGDVTFGSAQQRLADYKASLERLTTELGISDRVRFLGRRDDMPRVMAALDVLVHPSNEPEPFGRSIAEAQAGGKAVIGTRAGGIPELIDEGETGLLVAPGDSGALAAAIRRLLDDPALRERMGRRARERAQERFTVARHVASVQAVYDELL